MNFIYEPQLLAYMKAKKKNIIVVETVMIEHSEIEIMELHVHLIDEKQADYFKKKRYVSKNTEVGEVLLPPYKLQYAENIVFGIKRVFFFHFLTYTGIQNKSV